MNQKTLHMIANAHIDPVWLWKWQEGFHEVHATFSSVLYLMIVHDDLFFVSSSAAFYEWIEKSDPMMFDEIRQRVAEGRWEIVGGWWIQPDCNIPNGESFIRQGLYGQRYFKEKFNKITHVGYNVDSFGHNGMLPQILKKCGLDYYVFMRPSLHEKELPGRLFWWEADDGSRVLAYRIPFTYGTWGSELDEHIKVCASEAVDPYNELMCFFGVGDHGGGPTRENIDSIHRMQNDSSLPELVMSTPDRYFNEVIKKNLALPVVHDDLQHHASGCYAAHSDVKRWNRQTENLLLTAEKFSILAEWLTGQPYPGDFDRAWKNLLFNQFHDSLAGTCIESAYEDIQQQYGESLSIASRAINFAVQSLVWRINIPYEESMRPFVVFNPNAWGLKVYVEVETAELGDCDTLIYPDGKEIPFQKVQPEASVPGLNRIGFIAELPSTGYCVYRISKRESSLDNPPLAATSTMIENDRFRLEISPQSGVIKRLWDKKIQVEVFNGEAASAVVLDDPSDTWSHGVFRYDHLIGMFQVKSIRLIDNGPVKAVIRVTSGYEASELVQDFTMYRELDQIDVHVTVDWHEHFKMLKIRFPVNITSGKAVYEIPYGSIERPAKGDEEPGQKWVDLTGEGNNSKRRYGLSLLNDGKYSFDINGSDIGITVLRSPIYAHHMPYIPEPDRQYSFIDQGIQHFTYALLPHEGGWQDAGTVRRAAELNHKPIIVSATYHPGVFPLTESYLSVDQDNIYVSVNKKAEDNDDMIIRCVETSKKPADTVIYLPKWDRRIAAHFGPSEIKTFRIPRDPSLPLTETNLLEGLE